MPAGAGAGSPDEERLERTREAGRSAAQIVRESAVAGLTVLVPILITLLVFQAVAGYVVGVLNLPIRVLNGLGLAEETSMLIVQALVAAFLGLSVLAVGFLTRFRYGERAIDRVDAVIASVPGLGSVYKSFREMGDMMLESDAKNFRDVKLVEFPAEGSYTMGFLTTRTPEPLQEAAGRNDMVTLFLPLAPNPVMGGHLVHVPEDRVEDVDMTVEEGVRTVVTSGVATANPGASGGLSQERLREISEYAGDASGDVGDGLGDDRGRRRAMDADREREYERYAAEDPRDADHPDAVETSRRTDAIGETGHPEDAGDDRPVSDGDPDPRPTDLRDGEGVIGDDAEEPRSVERDREDTIGREADHPEAVSSDRSDTLGSDADRPEAVGESDIEDRADDS